MKLYDCKVRLAGNVMHEVYKPGITAAEIEIMRFVHGPDSCVDIKAVGEAKNDDGSPRTSAQERKRLNALYVNPDMLNSLQFKQKTDMMRSLFGHARAPLPEDIEDIAVQEVESDDDEVVEAAAAPVVARRTKKAPAPESFAE